MSNYWVPSRGRYYCSVNGISCVIVGDTHHEIFKEAGCQAFLFFSIF